MRDKPLVSAIIIFLNAGAFINEAIESVFGQAYDHWELFLVDDGSTDASTAIARQYAAQHPDRVRYLEHRGHQNRGMSASRNLGIRQAKGRYIGFLDADDVWLPHKLEQQVAILESNPEVAMVYGPGQVWHGWTGNIDDVRRDFIQNLDVQSNQSIKPPALVSLFLRNGSASPAPSAILVRPDAIERAGGFEELFWAGTQLYDDQAFYIKVCLEAPVYVAQECWYRYRRHPDAHCVAAFHARKQHYARLAFLSWVKGHLLRRNVRDPDVWRALQSALQAKELRPYRRPLVYGLVEYTKRLTTHFERLVRSALRCAIPAPVRFWLRGR